MTAWDLEPGRWEIVQGIDTDSDDIVDGAPLVSTVELERSGTIELTLLPRTTTVLTLKLQSKGTPYWTRPDLGIGKDDVVVRGKQVRVTIHSLGSVAAPPTGLALLDKDGKVLSSVTVPGLRAPTDLLPKTLTMTLTLPAGGSVIGGSVVIDPDATTKEITRTNNRVRL